MHMVMLSLHKCMAGNASFVPLRQRTKLGLKSCILVMALCTSMVLMDPSGYAAINARIDTILLVSARIKKNQLNGPFSALFWNANSKWVEVDLHSKSRVKRVTVSVAVVKQKVGKPRPPPLPPPWHGKDGRRIGVRQRASSGKGKKEQLWQEQDMERAFTLWEENSSKQAKDKLSKRQIALQCGIPYTTFCERVSGKRAGCQREPKILDRGEEVGNISSG